MCMLCWMCSDTMRDKVRNEDIRTKIGVASIEEKIRENRLFGGKIEDREVNSLFDCKESYSGSIILLQEREDIQA